MRKFSGHRIIFSVMRLSLIDKIFSVIGAANKDERKDPRRKEELPVEIEILSENSDAGNNNVLYAQIKDISAGGVKILTSVYIPLSVSVRMKITLEISMRNAGRKCKAKLKFTSLL